jgi:hypothetical protein
MRYPCSPADVDRFRSVVARCLGLQFDDDKLGFLADVVRRRLEVSGQTPDVYLARLETESLDDEIGALSHELTVPETYFFRHNDQYRLRRDCSAGSLGRAVRCPTPAHPVGRLRLRRRSVLARHARSRGRHGSVLGRVNPRRRCEPRNREQSDARSVFGVGLT